MTAGPNRQKTAEDSLGLPLHLFEPDRPAELRQRPGPMGQNLESPLFVNSKGAIHLSPRTQCRPRRKAPKCHLFRPSNAVPVPHGAVRP